MQIAHIANAESLPPEGYRLVGHHGILPIWEKPDEPEDFPDWLKPKGKVQEPVRPYKHLLTKLLFLTR